MANHAEKTRIVHALDNLLTDIAPKATFTVDICCGHVTRAGLKNFRLEQSPPPSPPSPSLLAPPKKARKLLGRCPKHEDIIDGATPTVTYSDIRKHKAANDDYVTNNNLPGIFCEICGENDETMCECDFNNCSICNANWVQLRRHNDAFFCKKK